MKVATSRTTMIGLALATIGAFLAFDPGHRAAMFYDGLVETWPWLLLSVAAAGLLQMMENRAPVVVAACLASVAALGLQGLPELGWRTVAEVAPWVGVAVGVGLVTRAAARRLPRHVSAIVPRRVRARRGPLPGRTDLLCVTGVLHFDARSALAVDEPEIVARLACAVAVIVIPREWRCHLTAAELHRASIREEGPVPATGPVLRLKVAAWGSALVVRRV